MNVDRKKQYSAPKKVYLKVGSWHDINKYELILHFKQQTFISVVHTYRKLMVENNSKQITILSEVANIQQRRLMVQNYCLIWLDLNINKCKNNFQNILEQLRSIVSDINIFTDVDQCVDFLTDIDDQKVFMIISEISMECIIPNIHEILSLDSIYIFSDRKNIDEEWIKKWPKIKSTHPDITSICETLQQATKQCDQNLIPISFIPTNHGTINENLDQLEPLFMYTQIFKEILLEMDYNQQSINDFTAYCRNGDYGSLSNINKFQKEYCSTAAIWWYTYPAFIFSMLNRALRLMEADRIIKMGFFIRDLYYQIQELHHLQYHNHHGESLIVYRGQGLSKIDFEKLMNTKGGLISFNCFLSTSGNREIANGFVEIALTDPNLIGILFKMTVDTSVSSAPFATIDKVSYFKTEQEILFSMHTIFRIVDVVSINENNRLYQVELRLTADEDQELQILTAYLRNETSALTAWERLSKLLVSIGQYEKAEDFFKVLLEQTSIEKRKGLLYNQLGYIRERQCDYEKAIFYYEKSLEIKEKTHPPDYSALVICYNNIGEVYRNLEDYSKALSFYEKAISIQESSVSLFPPSLPASAYNNIGLLYTKMAQYSKALFYMKKALEIRQKTLPSNHPELALSYSTMGMIYDNMSQYSTALSFYGKSLEIHQKSLPPNHPSFIFSYNSMAKIFEKMREYSKSLSFHKKAIEICKETLPPNHRSLAVCYSNMALVYEHINDYSKALSFQQEALQILEKTLPLGHSDLAGIYTNIAGLYNSTGKNSQALSFYYKALEIYQKTFSPNHPLLATVYNNIGRMYQDAGNNREALSFYEKALEIREKTLPSYHLDFAQSYNNIASVHYHIGNYAKALFFLERALDISQRLLPTNHPHLQHVRKGIEMVKEKL